MCVCVCLCVCVCVYVCVWVYACVCTRETPLGKPLIRARFRGFRVPWVPSFVLTGNLTSEIPQVERNLRFPSHFSLEKFWNISYNIGKNQVSNKNVIRKRLYARGCMYIMSVRAKYICWQLMRRISRFYAPIVRIFCLCAEDLPRSCHPWNAWFR